jgi:hypothetical protein
VEPDRARRPDARPPLVAARAHDEEPQAAPRPALRARRRAAALAARARRVGPASRTTCSPGAAAAPYPA